jgi:hypothetical protein
VAVLLINIDVNRFRFIAFNTHGTFAMHREHLMLKNTLIAALLATSGFAAFAQTTAIVAKPAASTPAAAPAKAPSSMPATAPAMGAKAVTDEPAVKKSKNDICHDKTSSGYAQTKNFKPFTTMDECVKSGGRPPKGNAK